MAIQFVVEDGSSLANATSYVSLASCDQYQENRARTAWASASTETRETAIIRGTQFVDMMDYVGFRTGVNQALRWPRYGDTSYGWNGLQISSITSASFYRGVIDSDGYYISPNTVPKEVKNATYEASYIEQQNPGELMKSYEAYISSIGLGNGALKVTYNGSKQAKKYPLIMKYLRGLLKGTGGVYDVTLLRV